MGSSLSNGNHPEEALGAYREALQLRPTYTRAIYNVGVACMSSFSLSLQILKCSLIGLNIGAHKEAAEHFLSALAMQETSNGTKSDQLWFTLRRVFLSMVSITRLFHRFLLIFDNFDTFDRTEVISLKWPRLGLMWMSSEEMALISNIFFPFVFDRCTTMLLLQHSGI